MLHCFAKQDANASVGYSHPAVKGDHAYMKHKITNKSCVFKATHFSSYNQIPSPKGKWKHAANWEIHIRVFLPSSVSHYIHTSNSKECLMLWFMISAVQESLKVFLGFVTNMTKMETTGDNDGQMMGFEILKILPFPSCELQFPTRTITILSSPGLLCYTCVITRYFYT